MILLFSPSFSGRFGERTRPSRLPRMVENPDRANAQPGFRHESAPVGISVIRKNDLNRVWVSRLEVLQAFLG